MQQYPPPPGQPYFQQPFMFQGQVMPYYPVLMGYPDYSMYQHYQYYMSQFQNNPYMNMNGHNGSANGMNGYAPRKKHVKGYTNNNYNGYYKNLSSSAHSLTLQTTSETPPPEEKKEVKEVKQEEEVEAEDDGPETPFENEESLPLLPAGELPTEAEQEVPQGDAQPELGDKTLPLLFSIAMQDFLDEKRTHAEQNRQLLAYKTSQLDDFLKTDGYTINKYRMQRIVDHNTGGDYQRRIFPESASINDNDNDNNAPQAAVSNWASIILQSAKKQQKKPKAVAAATPATPTVPELKESPQPQDVGPQPLGLLVVKMLFDPAFHLASYPTYHIKPRGLTNTGNICYMNAVLQCLLFCEPFSRVLRLVSEQSIGTLSETSATPLIDATIAFIDDFVKLPTTSGSVFNSDGIVVGRPLSPENLYMKLIENPKFQHLTWGQQEDAEEFLVYYLDGLHEEFVEVEAQVTPQQMEQLATRYGEKLDSLLQAELKTRMRNAMRLVRSEEHKHVEETKEEDEGWSEVGSGRRTSKKRTLEVEPSPITELFGGCFRSVLTIPKGKDFQSITVDPFRCISLDISLAERIEDALWRFSDVEKIPFKIDDKEVVARKQTFIDSLPPVLILQLKRFSYQLEKRDNVFEEEEENANEKEVPAVGTIEKVMKNVQYGLDLTVPAECLSAAVRGVEKRDYQLIGVIYHHGRNAEGGHYTCDVLRDENRWIRIDDTAVEAIAAEAVTAKPDARDKSAYILMYHRK